MVGDWQRFLPGKGRMFAYLSEKVYLSDEGNITKIFLCPLGDYIFQYFRKEMPKYTEPFTWFAATRMPEPPPFRTILKTISIEGMGEMAPPIVLSTEVLPRAFQIIEKIGSITPEDSINALMYMENSRAFWVSTNFMASHKKGKKKSTKEEIYSKTIS